MTKVRYQDPFFQILESAGVTIPGGQLFFFAAGTTTLNDTFQDEPLTIANTNPITDNATSTIPMLIRNLGTNLSPDATHYPVGHQVDCIARLRLLIIHKSALCFFWPRALSHRSLGQAQRRPMTDFFALEN